jgi:hypothetical protein
MVSRIVVQFESVYQYDRGWLNKYLFMTKKEGHYFNDNILATRRST